MGMFDALLPLASRPGDFVKPAPRSPKVHVVTNMAKAVRFPKVPNPWNLSAMQMECMRLYVEGMQVGAIGEHIHLSEKTVSAHMTRAREKIGAATVLHAALEFARWKWADGEAPEPPPGVLILRWRGGQATVRMDEQAIDAISRGQPAP